MNWTDERLIGQTEEAKCNPVFPATATIWIPGDDIFFNTIIMFYGLGNYNRCSNSLMLTSVADLTLLSSQSTNKLTDLLSRESHYLIDENGTVYMWGAASFDLNCKSMDFSDYPYDKHKCEFLIHSNIYSEVKPTIELPLETGQFHYFI